MFSSRHFSFLLPIERQLATNKMLGCPFIGNSSETYNTTRRKTFFICEAFRCPRAKLDFNTLPFIEKSSTEVAYTFSARVAMAYNRASSFPQSLIWNKLFPNNFISFREPMTPFAVSEFLWTQKYVLAKSIKKTFQEKLIFLTKHSMRPEWVVKAAKLCVGG